MNRICSMLLFVCTLQHFDRAEEMLFYQIVARWMMKTKRNYLFFGVHLLLVTFRQSQSLPYSWHRMLVISVTAYIATSSLACASLSTRLSSTRRIVLWLSRASCRMNAGDIHAYSTMTSLMKSPIYVSSRFSRNRETQNAKDGLRFFEFGFGKPVFFGNCQH